MGWSIVNFGKYKDKTLPQIAFVDLDWFFWNFERNAFTNKDRLHFEAVNLDRKVRAIRIPKNVDGHLMAEYIFSQGVFHELRIVPSDLPKHEGASRTIRTPVIDLSVPRRAKDYDKSGYELLIRDLKRILFGNSNFRMTQQRCEQFFDNADNFEV